jgi:hypothetical protein
MSLIKSRIKVIFVLKIIYMSKHQNVTIRFNDHMTNLAKNNYYLEGFKNSKLFLDRSFDYENKTYFFNEQHLILERPIEYINKCYDSSISLFLDHVLLGYDKSLIKLYIRSKPYIYKSNLNVPPPPAIYYCSNVKAKSEYRSKFNSLNNLLKHKEISGPKRHVLVNEFKLETNLYDNECDEEVDSIIAIEEEEEEIMRPVRKRIIISPKKSINSTFVRRVSTRIKKPIKRIQL